MVVLHARHTTETRLFYSSHPAAQRLRTKIPSYLRYLMVATPRNVDIRPLQALMQCDMPHLTSLDVSQFSNIARLPVPPKRLVSLQTLIISRLEAEKVVKVELSLPWLDWTTDLADHQLTTLVAPIQQIEHLCDVRKDSMAGKSRLQRLVLVASKFLDEFVLPAYKWLDMVVTRFPHLRTVQFEGLNVTTCLFEERPSPAFRRFLALPGLERLVVSERGDHINVSKRNGTLALRWTACDDDFECVLKAVVTHPSWRIHTLQLHASTTPLYIAYMLNDQLTHILLSGLHTLRVAYHHLDNLAVAQDRRIASGLGSTFPHLRLLDVDLHEPPLADLPDVRLWKEIFPNLTTIHLRRLPARLVPLADDFIHLFPSLLIRLMD
jgi:hypothetical protein